MEYTAKLNYLIKDGDFSLIEQPDYYSKYDIVINS